MLELRLLRWILGMAVLLVVTTSIAAVASVLNVQHTLPLEERVKLLEDARKDQQKRNEAVDLFDDRLWQELERIETALRIKPNARPDTPGTH